MIFLKKVGFYFIYVFSSIFILNLVITFLNYFDIIKDNILYLLKILILIISLFIGGFFTGKKQNKKGYLEGLKMGSIFSLFILIINFLIYNNNFKIKYLLFYIIIIFSSVLGSMIGINKKKSN